MRRPFGKLMEMVAAVTDQEVTLGQLAQQWDEPVTRIMDAMDAVRILHGEIPYIEIRD